MSRAGSLNITATVCREVEPRLLLAVVRYYIPPRKALAASGRGEGEEVRPEFIENWEFGLNLHFQCGNLRLASKSRIGRKRKGKILRQGIQRIQGHRFLLSSEELLGFGEVDSCNDQSNHFLR